MPIQARDFPLCQQSNSTPAARVSRVRVLPDGDLRRQLEEPETSSPTPKRMRMEDMNAVLYPNRKELQRRLNSVTANLSNLQTVYKNLEMEAESIRETIASLDPVIE